MSRLKFEKVCLSKSLAKAVAVMISSEKTVSLSKTSTLHNFSSAEFFWESKSARALLTERSLTLSESIDEAVDFFF